MQLAHHKVAMTALCSPPSCYLETSLMPFADGCCITCQPPCLLSNEVCGIAVHLPGLHRDSLGSRSAVSHVPVQD